MHFQGSKILKRKKEKQNPEPEATKFLDLPREIRDYIYIAILASSSNEVTLSPWTVEVTRSMTILQTCKQIQQECKEIIWQHNGLRLCDSTQLFAKFKDLMNADDEGLVNLRRRQHIRITLEVLDRDELEWVYSGLKALADLSKQGTLKSISLVAINDRPRGIEEYEEELELMCSGELVDGRLFGGGPDGKSLIYKTSWPHFSHWGKQPWLREMLLNRSDMADLLQALHALFGGKLLVDGRLCPKGIPPKDCKLNPRDGEIRIVLA